jgi:UPF0755 protein
MKKVLSILLLLFILLLFFSLYFWQGIYLPKDDFLKEEKIFSIKKGEGVREISNNLEKQGFIKDKNFFELYIFLNDYIGGLKAGEYLISPAMNVKEIASKFYFGEVAREKITIIEGWNIKNIADYLEEESFFSNEEFISFVSSLEKHSNLLNKFSILKNKPKELSLEGYLFPDTYYVDKSIGLQEIVEIMIRNLDNKITVDMKDEIGKQGKSFFEIMVMASLIEKEVRVMEDKKIVSGILWKRMQIGMPLQVDATIAYITGKRTTRISTEETKIDSPYNTYKYRGLPIGPICNPGFESILASLYYEDSDYLYYLSTPEGETIFSKTLEEHNIAKFKYLK